MTPLEPGLEFLPHLTLVRRLGRGGMGEVWVARDTSRGEEVVAKLLPADAPAERVALLRREARLVRKVQHPGIVPVYGFEQGPHGSAVVSRYMTGGDAGRLRGGEPLAILRLGSEVASALGHLHGLGVVHRDVKPTNVLLDESGRAHLADFGIAAVAAPLDDEGLVLHGGGSRASMSPQQRAGAPAQPADDVYALGALLHELLSGRPPLSEEATGDEARSVSPSPLAGPRVLPESLRALVASMLAKAPEERPRDMAAVEEALRRIERELEAPARAVSRPRDVRLQPPPRVPGVGVGTPSAPVSASSTPSPRPPRSLSLAQVALLGLLAAAVLFVVLVLPRLAVRPTEQSAASPDAAPTAPPAEAELTATARPEAPPARPVDQAIPAEATPTPRPAPPEPTPEAVQPPGPIPSRESGGGGVGAPFAAAMSDAEAALARGDWPAAREGLARAAALDPRSPAVADARGRIEEAERTAALARQRDLARDFEAKEDWRRAQAEYETALRLDPAVAFALEGRERATGRAELAERLAYHVDHPLRLATDAVAREAEGLLQQAREVDAPGPRHRKQVSDLERALVEVRTPVAVVLESDGKTEVVVHKVGRLGAFERKTLDLRPGTYTVVGTRSGYRDVRRQLVVKPATTPSPVVVRCEEAI